MDKTVELLQRQLERERLARKQAEAILELKSLELFRSNQELLRLNNSLEEEVKKRTEELVEEKKQLNHLIESYPLPLLLVSKKDLSIVDVNQFGLQVFQVEQKSIIGLKYDKWALKVKNSNIFSKSKVDGERKIKINDEYIYFQAHTTEIKFRNQELYLINLYDLTEQKKIFEDFSENQRAYRELVENVSDIIFRADKNGRFTFVNQTAIHITGYSNEELVGSHFNLFVREDFQSKLIGFYRFQFENNVQSTYIEFPIITKSKKEIWIGQTVNIHNLDSGEKEIIALSRDITDRKKAEKALILSEDKYRSIIENLELGLLEVDKQGKIVRAYPQFCLLTGYDPDELKGKDALEIFADEAGKKIIAAESEKRKKGIPSVYELELIRKDKSKVWVLISGAPFYNEKNEIAGTVGIHVDISERKRMEAELISAKEIAENSLKSKDLFVANMSHEIRTPLNAILGMSQLLQNSGLTDRQHKYVEAIHTSSENLLTIVNDLLDFAKIESGKMELDIASNNLYKIIQNVIQLWNLKIDQKGLTFIKDFDIPEKAFYLFDSTRLFGILNNLIHNALKFTTHGYISIQVSIEKSNQDEDEIKFSIEDTGIGISNEKQELIFESFIQAENTTSRNFGGTGLGLAIVKQLVEKMNGKIEVISELNVGSTFSFTIPLKKCSSPLEIKEKKIASGFLKNKTVLLVEDNEINRFMAQTILESWEMLVFTAENGAAAVEFLNSKSVDVILMDMQMPVLDGVQATWMIRNKLKVSIPIIALTANASQSEKEKCLNAGMNLYLSKPYKQEELLEVFAEIFNHEVEIVLSENNVDFIQKEHSLVDLTLLIQNTNNDLVFMKKMIQLVITETTKKASEIEQLSKDKNFDGIKRIAHSMKPSLDHVSVKEIRTLVREVESFPKPEIPESLLKHLVTLLHLLVDQLKEVQN